MVIKALAEKKDKILKIREDFPILSRVLYGNKALVYFDNGATTQKPKQVIDSIVDYYTNYNSNVHRGVHYLSDEATNKYEEVRQKVAKFINVTDIESIIYTRNTTESINLVANAWGNQNIKAGDEIVISLMEHHSNIVPWQLLAERTGAIIKYLPLDAEGKILLEELDNIITEKTKITCVTQVSNSVGTINPVKLITKKAHEKGSLMLVDGAQSTPHMPIDVTDIDCDFFVFSAHKMVGPTGIGILYAKKEILENTEPFLGGGDMILNVWTDRRPEWNELPWKFEAGTPNIADAIAFGAALDYLNDIGMDFIYNYEKEITKYAMTRIHEEYPDIKIYGPEDINFKAGMISFTMSEAHPHDIGTILDQEGIAIRAGHHCAQPLMKHFGIGATARASLYFYNTKEEVDIFISALKKIKEIFGRVTRR